MFKFKKIYFLFVLITILTNCSNLSDAGKVLRNEKITNSDEFLVKKRGPLVLPPDYKDIPEPGSIMKNEMDEKKKIKKILKVPESSNSNINKNSSIEETIINQIKR